MPCQHRPSGDKNGRNIDPGRSHQKAGHILIAVGHHYQPVKSMGHRHTFRAVTDQISRHQRIFHADVAHGYAVTDCNRRKHNGGSSRHRHSQLYGFHDFVQVHMSRNDLIIGTHDPDQGALPLFLRDAQCIEQASVRRLLYPCFYRITSHRSSLRPFFAICFLSQMKNGPRDIPLYAFPFLSQIRSARRSPIRLQPTFVQPSDIISAVL